MRIKGSNQKIDVDIVMEKFEKTVEEFWNKEKGEYSTEHIKFDIKEFDNN